MATSHYSPKYKILFVIAVVIFSFAFFNLIEKDQAVSQDYASMGTDSGFVVLVLVVAIFIFTIYAFNKQAFNKYSQQLQRMFNKPVLRYYILIGMVLFVCIMYIDYYIKHGSFETGIIDWGQDMGYSWIGWGIMFLIFLIAIIVYPKQFVFRKEILTKAVDVILGSWWILFAFLFLWGFQALAHHPDLNYYHAENFLLGAEFNDKISHFLGTIAGTLFFVSLFYAMGPKYRYTLPFVAVIVLLGTFMYELYETQFMWYLIDANKENTSAFAQFEYEMNDTLYDMVLNTIGWLIALFIMRKKIIR